MKNHVINKVSFQIPAENYAQAQSVQSNTKHWAKNSLPIILDKYFNANFGEKDLIYLDKFEIEIPDYPWKISDEIWAKKIGEILNKSQKNGFEKIVFKKWLFYLLNGSFEKDSFLKSKIEFEQYLIENIRQITESELVEFKQLQFSTSFLKRLFFQFSEEFLITFFTKLLKIDSFLSKKFVKKIRKQLTNFPENTLEVFEKIISISQNLEQRKLNKFIENLIESPENKPFADHIFKKIEEEIIHEKKQKTPALETLIHCENAGLVILFPYLQRFFENTSLAKNNEFIDENSQKIAAKSLHYLATGLSYSVDDEYIIPKILCGIELEEYLEFTEELPENIKAESDELLIAVIENWDKLQSTSIEGLRETFLKRAGQIQLKNGEYLLQVEESGVDILLNTIPWGFRLIKLPWMKNKLITEWY